MTRLNRQMPNVCVAPNDSAQLKMKNVFQCKTYADNDTNSDVVEHRNDSVVGSLNGQLKSGTGIERHSFH